MEMIVRIAKELYVPKVTGSVCEALSLLIKNNLKPHFLTGTHMKFRKMRLWNLECNDIFTLNKAVLESLKTTLYHQRSKYNKLAIKAVI